MVLVAAALVVGLPSVVTTPAGAQDDLPGYCGPVGELLANWSPAPGTDPDYAAQAARGPDLLQAARDAVVDGDDGAGLVQEGFVLFEGTVDELADAVMAAGGSLSDVPAAEREALVARVVGVRNRFGRILLDNCGPSPIGAVIEPCQFGPVSMPSLLGVLTEGSPVDVTIDRQVMTVGVMAEPGDRTPEDVVFTQIEPGVDIDDVLLDGQPGLIIAEIGCDEVTTGIDQSDFTGLINASVQPDCDDLSQPERLVIEPNKTLSEALGVDAMNGGVGAPFTLAIEVNGEAIDVPMPEGLVIDAADGIPMITVDGRELPVAAVACAPSSPIDAPSTPGSPSAPDSAAAPLAPKFTG